MKLLSERMVSVGGDVDGATVCVRVAGDSLDPASITRELEAKPTYSARKGERRRAGESFMSQPTGVWLLSESVGGGKDLCGAIRRLLGRISDQPATWDQLAENYELNLMCGLFLDEWNQGIGIEPDVLEMLGDRHLALSLDIYYGREHVPRKRKRKK